MSQELAKQILKELGGKATMPQIVAEAKRKYPDSDLYTYIDKRIKALLKWKEVTYKDERIPGYFHKTQRTWYLVEPQIVTT